MYIKPFIKIHLLPHSGMSQGGPRAIDLSPVLYHGTERMVVEMWSKNGIFHTLSTLGDPIIASSYASYRVGYNSRGTIELWSDRNRIINSDKETAKLYGVEAEHKRLVRGEVIQSLAIFDRDELLGVKTNWLRRCYDEDTLFGSLRLEWPNNSPVRERMIPFSAVIASMDFSIDNGSIAFKVFNEKLWRNNFSLDPPRLKSHDFKDPGALAFAVFFGDR